MITGTKWEGECEHIKDQLVALAVAIRYIMADGLLFGKR